MVAAVACQRSPVAMSSASMSVRVARNSRMSRYIAQSLLPYLASTMRLTASRWDFLASQMATNCTSFSGSIQSQVVGAPVADAHAAEDDALAGRHGAVEAQRRSGDEARRRNRAASKHGAFKKLPPSERRPAGSSSGWMGVANFGKRIVLRHEATLTTPAFTAQRILWLTHFVVRGYQGAELTGQALESAHQGACLPVRHVRTDPRRSPAPLAEQPAPGSLQHAGNGRRHRQRTHGITAPGNHSRTERAEAIASACRKDVQP